MIPKVECCITAINSGIDMLMEGEKYAKARKVIVEGTDGTFNYMPLEGTGLLADSSEFVHLVVVGMSKMGIAMGLEALQQAHYLNSAIARTRVTFIDTNADKEMSFFKGRYANLFELVRTRFIDASVSAGPSLYKAKWEDPIADGKWAHLTEDNENFLDVEIEFIKGSLECHLRLRYVAEDDGNLRTVTQETDPCEVLAP